MSIPMGPKPEWKKLAPRDDDTGPHFSYEPLPAHMHAVATEMRCTCGHVSYSFAFSFHEQIVAKASNLPSMEFAQMRAAEAAALFCLHLIAHGDHKAQRKAQ